MNKNIITKLEVNLSIFYFGFVILLLFKKKETQLLIESGDINLSDIDIVVGSDHGQGAF